MVTITKNGEKAISATMEGKKMKFSKIAVSDIYYAEEERKELILLEGIKKEADIAKINTNEKNEVEILCIIENTETEENYTIRSVGIYVELEEEEILYAVYSTKENADRMPSYNEVPTSITYNIAVKIGKAENVDYIINQGGYVSAKQFVEMQTKVERNCKNIEKNSVNILAIDMAISIMHRSTVAGTADNIFVETLEDDNSVRIANGIYDGKSKRIYA